MATQNAAGQVFANNSDGFTVGGGTTERDLTITGANVSIVGSGSAAITFPTSTSTLATLDLAETFTGHKEIAGAATNSNAAAGYIGEYISSTLAIGSAVSLTTATTANVTSISLTAGDWDVSGNVGFIGAAGTLPTIEIAAIGQTSATLPTSPNGGMYSREDIALPAASTQIIPIATGRISLASTTTVYLVAQATFSVSTLTAYGFIGARRAR